MDIAAYVQQACIRFDGLLKDFPQRISLLVFTELDGRHLGNGAKGSSSLTGFQEPNSEGTFNGSSVSPAHSLATQILSLRNDDGVKRRIEFVLQNAAMDDPTKVTPL